MTNYLLVNRGIEAGGVLSMLTISDIEVYCVNVTAEMAVGMWCHDISHHIFILTEDRPDDTKKRHKDSKKWYSRQDKCDGLSDIFFTNI